MMWKMSTLGLLAVGLTACGGGAELEVPASATPMAEEPVADAPAAEAVAPADDLAASTKIEAARFAARVTLTGLDSLTKVEVKAEDGGDLTRTVVGYTHKDAVVVLVEVLDVGEYGRTEVRHVLKGGKPVYRSRKGFTHDPTDGQDSRFKLFEEEVVLAEGGAVLDARERATHTEGHPPEGTALPEEWTPVEDLEKVDVAELLALFP